MKADVETAPGRAGARTDGTARRTALMSPSEDRRQRVVESLHVGNPGNTARVLVEALERRVETPIELDLDCVRGFDGNPRRRLNPKFDEIKASIREVGIQTPLAVTRRPHETHYTLESGGNTRLLALRELWEETRDPRFRRVVAVSRPWKSERHLIGAHLIENELRGDLSFWDKAVGMEALKQAIEAEAARALTLRELVTEFGCLGLTVGHGSISYCMFAVERLRVLGERIPGLSGLDVRQLQPRLNTLKRYAKEHASMSEEVLYERVLEPVFVAVADRCVDGIAFSVTELYARCEEALACALGHPVDALRSLPGAAFMVDAPAVVAPVSATGDEPVVGTGNEVVVDSGGSVCRDNAPPRRAIAGLGRRLLAFAKASEIAGCLDVHAGDEGQWGLRPLPGDGGYTHTQARAWHLMALLLGVTTDSAPSWALDAAFVRWLIDSEDASARAWWDVLSLLRTSGEQLRGMLGREEAAT